MVCVTEITNVFAPEENKKVTFKSPGKELITYIPPLLKEYVVSVNGTIINDTSIIVEDDSQIIIVPVIKNGGGSKDFLRIAAFLALSYFAPGISSAIAQQLQVTSQLGGFLIQAGVMAAGGMLINAVLPPQLPDNQYAQDNSPTYSWSGAQTSPTPGAPIPILYGQMRLPGSVIGQYIKEEGDDSYLYTLLALCEGEVEQIAIHDILIDNNPIVNYEDVSYTWRRGTQTQDPDSSYLQLRSLTDLNGPAIKWFTAVSTANVFSVEVPKDTPAVRTTSGNAVEGIEINITLPNGLYYVNDRGGFETRQVEFKIEYSSDGGATWTVVTNKEQEFAPLEYEWALYDEYYQKLEVVWSVDQPTSSNYGYDFNKTGRKRQLVVTTQEFDSWFIQAASSTTIKKQITIEDLNPDSYDIRVTKITEDKDTTREKNILYWSGMNELNYSKLYYPYIALLGLKIKATGQLSGNAPNISTIVRRSEIPIYDQDGVFVKNARSDNPAWAAWDIITNKRYGLAKGYDRVDFQAFSEFASWCDEAIPDGKGGVEPRATFNGVIDFQSNMWSVLQQICSVGRASPIIKGTSYSVVVDNPSTPTQLFTMGNIIEGSYRASYTGVADLSNEVEISYVDSSADYTKQIVSVLMGTGGNKTTIQSLGTTTASQAYRLGRYLLQTNDKQRRLIEFDASIDSIACNIGDVIYFAHDVPQFGFSGRIVSATSTTITLDRKVYCETTKTYKITIRHIDDSLLTYTLDAVAADGDYDTFTVSSGFTTLPQQYELYTFGEESKEYIKLRVSSISRKTDMVRHLTCVDYNESILTDTTTVLPESRPSALTGFPVVKDVVVSEHLEKRADGTIVPFIDFSWAIGDDRLATVNILYSNDNQNTWRTVEQDLKENFYSLNALSFEENKTYYFLFQTKDMTGQQPIDEATVVSHSYSGKSAPPEDVTGFTYSITTNGILLSWNPNTDLDLSGYNLYFDGVQIESNLKATTYLYSDISLGLHEFGIKAVDTSGNESSNLVTSSLDMQGPTITSLSSEVIDNNVLLTWEAQKGTVDIANYIVKRDGVEIGTKKGTFTIVFESREGDYTYTVIPVDIFGNQFDGKSITTKVGQPPDYVLNADWNSTFTGTTVNAKLDNGSLFLPVNTTETWEDHFVNNSWSSSQDQINAGYPIYSEPFLSSASYEEVFDYGATLASTKVSVATTLEIVQGSITELCTISISLDGTSWTDYVDTYQVYGTNFRYVKVKLDYSGTDSAVYLSKLNVKLDSKLKNDSGVATCSSSDASGTAVNFNVSFVDVESIVLTPKGTTAISAVYDFTDAPNPTTFYIYLFDSAGNRVSGDCGWQVKGY